MKITVNLDFETITELQQFFAGKTTAAIIQEVATLVPAPVATPAPEQVFAKPEVVAAPLAAPSFVAAAPLSIAPEAAMAIMVPPASAPLPPVVSPATTTPPVPVEPAPSTSALVVDKKGIPWDERIHASSKAFIADGTWRTKRGVDAALVTQVEAELRGFADLAATTPAPAPAPIPAPPPAPAPVAAAAGLSPYTQLVVDVSKAMTGKGLNPNVVVEACAALGVANLGEVQHRPELVEPIRAMLAQYL